MTYTECVITQDGESPVYGRCRIIIRIDDNAAGPYLVIRGTNDEPDAGETPHDIFLQSDEEIDRFAEVCKTMLRQASVVAEES